MKQGELARIDYTARNAANEVVDTTIAEEARKAGIYVESMVYKPILVAVGKEMVLKGVDEALLEMEEGQVKQVIENKDALMARLHRSPDLLDALLMTFTYSE